MKVINQRLKAIAAGDISATELEMRMAAELLHLRSELRSCTATIERMAKLIRKLKQAFDALRAVQQEEK